MLTLDLIQEEDSSSTQGQDACDKSFRIDLDKSLSHLSPDCPRSKTDSALSALTATMAEASGKSQSLPRETAVTWEEKPTQAEKGDSLVRTPQPVKRLTPAEKSRCASMDEILSQSETRTANGQTTAGHPRSLAPIPTGNLVPIGQLQDLISQKLERTQELLTEVRRAPSDGDCGGRGKGKGKDSPTGSKSSTEGARAEAERLLREAASTWGQAHEILEEVKELRALYRQLDSQTGAAMGSIASSSSVSPRTPSNISKQTQYRKSMM